MHTHRYIFIQKHAHTERVTYSYRNVHTHTQRYMEGKRERGNWREMVDSVLL